MVRGNPLSAIVNGVFQGQLFAAAACDSDIEIDDGEIDAAFQGPRFGVEKAPHVIASAHGAWALQFLVERVHDDS